eukprot:4032813-Pyramimonas_sp.AAC.1
MGGFLAGCCTGHVEVVPEAEHELPGVRGQDVPHDQRDVPLHGGPGALVADAEESQRGGVGRREPAANVLLPRGGWWQRVTLVGHVFTVDTTSSCHGCVARHGAAGEVGLLTVGGRVLLASRGQGARLPLLPLLLNGPLLQRGGLDRRTTAHTDLRGGGGSGNGDLLLHGRGHLRFRLLRHGRDFHAVHEDVIGSGDLRDAPILPQRASSVRHHRHRFGVGGRLFQPFS